jgi:hypothetical protein
MTPYVLLVLIIAYIFWGPETEGHDFGGGKGSAVNIIILPFWILFKIMIFCFQVLFLWYAVDKVKKTRRYRR